MRNLLFLSLSLMTLIFNANSLSAQTTAIPDRNFEEALIDLGYDIAPYDGSIPTANISGVTSLDFSYASNGTYMQIADLTGIQDFTALEYLNCSQNPIVNLDLTSNTNLTYLDCSLSGDNLVTLDITGLTNLTYLNLADNRNLPSVDVSTNTALTHFDCSWNETTSYDLSANTAITELLISENAYTSFDFTIFPNLTSLTSQRSNLTEIDLSSNRFLTYLDVSRGSEELTSLNIANGNNANITYFKSELTTVLSCIFVDDKTAAYLSTWAKEDNSFFLDPTDDCILTLIPDDKFEARLISLGYDELPKDGVVLTGNINTVTELDVSNKSISDLTGIQDFTALVDLDCSRNSLSTLDLSANTELTSLDCSSNDLTTIDITSHTALTSFDCGDNQLSTLDITQNTALEELYCGYNSAFASLDISKNIALLYFDCSGLELPSLDVSNNIALEYISCYENALTALDLSKNAALNEIDCGTNQLANLDVSANSNLEYLYAYENLLTSLTLAGAVSLYEIDCSYNLLETIDFSGNPALAYVYAYNNLLTDLDFTSNTMLEEIYVNDNKLISLNVNNQYNDLFTGFDSSNNPNLTCITVDDSNAAYLADWTKDASTSFCSESVSVQTISNNSEITVYPNPVVNNFTLTTNQTVESIKIFNVSGALVKEFAKQDSYSVSELTAGMYFVEIKTTEETSNQKIMIQ